MLSADATGFASGWLVAHFTPARQTATGFIVPAATRETPDRAGSASLGRVQGYPDGLQQLPPYGAAQRLKQRPGWAAWQRPQATARWQGLVACYELRSRSMFPRWCHLTSTVPRIMGQTGQLEWRACLVPVLNPQLEEWGFDLLGLVMGW